MDGMHVVDIAHAIQLAVAPVFLLCGIGVFWGVRTRRLARIVDRARHFEEALQGAQADLTDDAREQLAVATRRARLSFPVEVRVAIAALRIGPGEKK
jgi:hypothetical protein